MLVWKEADYFFSHLKQDVTAEYYTSVQCCNRPFWQTVTLSFHYKKGKSVCGSKSSGFCSPSCGGKCDSTYKRSGETKVLLIQS